MSLMPSWVWDRKKLQNFFFVGYFVAIIFAGVFDLSKFFQVSKVSKGSLGT